VRPGVSIRGGRTYQLRAAYPVANPAQAIGSDTPIALVFPDASVSRDR